MNFALESFQLNQNDINNLIISFIKNVEYNFVNRDSMNRFIFDPGFNSTMFCKVKEEIIDINIKIINVKKYPKILKDHPSEWI